MIGMDIEEDWVKSDAHIEFFGTFWRMNTFTG